MGITGKRRALLLTLLLIVPAILVLFLHHTEPEPTYRGKSLSYWIEVYWLDSLRPQPGRDAGDPEVALQSIGTNAFPFLIRWLQEKEPNPPKWVIWSADKLPRALQPKWAQPYYQPRHELSARAIRAFQQEYDLIIPELARLAADARNENGHSSIYALSILGSNGVPALVEALENSTHPQWNAVARALGNRNLGPFTNRVIHALIPNLRNEENWFAAINTLQQLHPQPEIVVPALVTCLDGSKDEVCWRAASILSTFGSNAQAALPALTNLLTDRRSSFREVATNAIRDITMASRVELEKPDQK